MKLEWKTQQSPRQPAEIDISSPEWLEGLQDGSYDKGLSVPDMRRGHAYAHGWLTGKLRQEPPTHKRH